MTLVKYEQSLVDWLANNVPIAENVAAYHGKLDSKELAQFATKTPAVLPAMLRTTLSSTRDSLIVSSAIFVLAKDIGSPKMSRQTVVLIIVNLISYLLPLFKANNVLIRTPPNKIVADNLFARDWDRHAIAAWAIYFEIEIEFDPDTVEEEMNQLCSVLVDLDTEEQELPNEPNIDIQHCE